MLRIDRGTAYQILMVLLYARDHDQPPDVIRDWVYRRYYNAMPPNSDGLGVVLYDVFRNYFKTNLDARPSDHQEDIETILKPLAAWNKSGDSGYGDLIDEVANILQSAYARNYMTTGVLQKLRQAVLIPSEIGALKSMLKKKEMGCSSCGKEFQDGEMTTLMHSDDGATVICSRCVHPQSVRCSEITCNNVVYIDKKSKVLGSKWCDKCLFARGKITSAELAKRTGVGVPEAPPTPFRVRGVDAEGRRIVVPAEQAPGTLPRAGATITFTPAGNDSATTDGGTR